MPPELPHPWAGSWAVFRPAAGPQQNRQLLDLGQRSRIPLLRRSQGRDPCVGRSHLWATPLRPRALHSGGLPSNRSRARHSETGKAQEANHGQSARSSQHHHGHSPKLYQQRAHVHGRSLGRGAGAQTSDSGSVARPGPRGQVSMVPDEVQEAVFTGYNARASLHAIVWCHPAFGLGGHPPVRGRRY